MKTKFNVLYCTGLNDFKIDLFVAALELSKQHNAVMNTLLGMDVDDIDRFYNGLKINFEEQSFDDLQQQLFFQAKDKINEYVRDGNELDYGETVLLERRNFDTIFDYLAYSNSQLLIIDSFKEDSISERNFKKKILDLSPTAVVVLSGL